jgi:hypothetical protein
MNDWSSLLFEADYGGSLGGVQTAVFVMLTAFVVGQFVGWVYMWTHHGLSYSQTFVMSLVIVPVLVSLMLLLLAGSIVVAFGLLAVFAVVRFRNVLKDTRDTVFILWAITEGLGIGTLRFSTSLVAALGVAAVLVYLKVADFGSRQRYDAVLTLRITGDAESGMSALQQVLRRHSRRVLLTNERRRTDVGADLAYRLLLRNPSRDGELKAELDQMPGLEQVALFLRNDESEI